MDLGQGRTPVFPAEWQDQFGLPYNEHKQAMQIDIFDGYAVYSIKETNNMKASADSPESNPQETGTDTVTPEV